MKGLKKLIFVLFLSSVGLSALAAPTNAALTNMNRQSSAKALQWTLTFNHSVHYQTMILSNPARFVLDFPQVRDGAQASLKKISLPDAIVQTVRIGQQKKLLRLVFELKEKSSPHITTHRTKAGYQLILTWPVPEKVLKPILTASEIKKNDLNKTKIVIIDPGHGGKDPGATGQLGTHEKDVVLGIGKYLSAELNKTKGIHAILTRNGDYFLPLRERLRLARKGEADIFIAIHADAYRVHTATGASIYALSERGATSEAARWLAQKENYSELMDGVDLSDKSYLLRSVLIDLSQTATIHDSLILGNDILKTLKTVTPLHSRHVEQAPFVVLKSPDIPSLLIETGFVTTRSEELKLRTPAYQQKLAHAIALGVIRYLKGAAPAVPAGAA